MFLRPPHLLAEYSTGGKGTRRWGAGGGGGGTFRWKWGNVLSSRRGRSVAVLLVQNWGHLNINWRYESHLFEMEEGCPDVEEQGAMHTITRNISGSLGNERGGAAPRRVD